MNKQSPPAPADVRLQGMSFISVRKKKKSEKVLQDLKALNVKRLSAGQGGLLWEQAAGAQLHQLHAEGEPSWVADVVHRG